MCNAQRCLRPNIRSQQKRFLIHVVAEHVLLVSSAATSLKSSTVSILGIWLYECSDLQGRACRLQSSLRRRSLVSHSRPTAPFGVERRYTLEWQ